MGGLGARGGARRRRLDGAGRPAVALPRRGGAPATGGRGGLSQELRGEVGVPFPGLVGAERGRRVGLRGGVELWRRQWWAAAMFWASGEAAGARGTGRRAPARGKKSGEGLGRDAWVPRRAGGGRGRH